MPRLNLDSMEKHWPFLRNVLLFFGGLGGVIHEITKGKIDRPTLLLVLAGMMGLPAFFRSDEKRKDDQ